MISNLLYEIRSNLEKKGVNPDNISLKKSSHFQEMYAPMKFRQEIPQYDAFENKHFLETLQRKTRSQQEIDLEKKLKRFEDFKIEQTKKIEQAKIEEEIRRKQELDLDIKNHRNKNQRYHAFLQQFEEKGINNWKNNMLRAKDREMKDINFELNQAIKMNRNIQRGIQKNINEYKRNVAQFEETFGDKKRKNQMKSANQEEIEVSQELNKSHQTNSNGELTNISQNVNKNFAEVEKSAELVKDKIFTKIMLDPRTKTERNRRRRKIIVEQGKAQLEIENKRREKQYIDKLAKQSNQEKQLTYEVYRVNQCSLIVRENRNLREEMYKKRAEQNIEFFGINEDNFLKIHIDNFKRDIEKEENRKKDLEISLKQKRRNVNSDACEHMIQLIIDIADEAHVYQQINDSEEIDDRVWREWTNIFINDQSVLAKKSSEEVNKDEEEKEIDIHQEEEVANELEKEEKKEVEEQKEEPNEEKKEDDEEFDVNNIKSNYNNTFYTIFHPEAKSSTLDQILDECEFFDYVNFIGQWNSNLIPEGAFITITPQDLVFDYVAPAGQQDNGKKDKGGKNVNAAKGQKDSIEDIIKEEAPENLVIPKENIKNVFLGDLIDILIEMRYEEENQKPQEEREKIEKEKNIFRYIPIKIALIGQDFSGKKTQAKILSENFPFKIYDLEQLAKNALSMLTKKNESKNNFLLSGALAMTNSASGDPNANTIAQMRTEQAQEEIKFSKIKELAHEIKRRLLNGEAISDDIYADLLVEYIKIDFPPKEDYEVVNEIIDRVQRKEKIQEEIEINIEQNSNRPIAFAKRDKELNDELMRISLEASKGFVVVNFPCTYNQAKLLESRLSGYIPQNETVLMKSTILKNAFSIVLDKSPKIYPPVKLLQGGFDFIFYLNVPSQECIRRAVGRRQYINKKTGEVSIYHLEDNPPPTNSDICENLCKVGDESSLVTRHLAFSTAVDQLIEFYQPFGFEKKQLKSFEEIDGNRGKDYVTQDLISYVNRLVAINEENDKEVYEKSQEEDSFEEEEENENNISGLNEKSGDGMILNENNINNSGNAQSNERKEEKSNNEVPDKAEEEQKEKDEKMLDGIQDKENNEQQQIAKIEEPVDEYTKYTNKINEIKSTLNKDLSQVLLKIWSKLFENYVNECKSIFKFLRVQRENISSNYNLICQKFIDFLKRPSKKQILLLDYQMKYNKFLDDYPDLKDEPQVKEEHHQEVDDLNDKIYEIIETRKNEAIDERKKIMTSGWIENEMEKFYMALERLFQNEIDKFIGSMQIMRDFYHNLDNRPLIELPFTTIDIIKDEIDPTPIEVFPENPENQNNNLPEQYPRIEKLYKTCLKIQFQYEEAIRESEKARQDKQNDNNKKQAGNKGKKNQPAQNQEEGQEISYPHNEELKQALNNEKAKYKYKITLLKYWGILCLQNIRKLSLSVYNKLEDWIILAIKAENEALNQLTTMLKENIEKEAKIKYELALDTFDVIVNMDVQNYIELPPQPLPAKEVIDHNKFNITQLKILMEELQTYLVEDTTSIRSSTFISIFIKKYIASKNDNDVYYGIPNLLRNLSFYNYFKFIKKLDAENTDLVSLHHIGTYFALLNCVVPTEDNIKDIVSQCEKIINYYESPEVNKEQFVSIKFWFDENEKSITLPNHEDFERDKKLKEILFSINKGDGDVVNMNDFISILNLKSIDMDAEKYPGKTYYEILFY